MTEETEVVQEETQAQEEVQNTQESNQETVQTQSQTSKKDDSRHWEEARNVLKMQKQQIEELQGELERLKKPVIQEEPDEFATLDPEDYLTVDKAKKMAEKLAEKKAAQTARQIVEEYMQKQNIQNDESRMRSKYEDYDYVIENFALPQIKADPALAHKIQNSKNPAETAYKIGKLSENYEEPQAKPTNAKAEKILKNASRPVSSHAVGGNFKSQADQFSKMSKDEIWSLSEKYARGSA